MKKNTKRSLLLSVLALILCCALLAGTTLAWFTDSASTAVNKIEAGTLDVALEMKEGNEWVDAEGKTLQFKKAAGAAADEAVLWEPGCTYVLPELRIVNKGNLALKYKIQITGIKGDAELNNAIEWTINDANLGADHSLAAGAAANLTIQGHMKEEAGNEYQGLSIDGIGITVLATQDTVEYDSSSNQYDAGAQYPVFVEDEASLKNALNEGKNVRLGSDITLTAPITINGDVEVIGDGNSVISAQPVYVAADANVSFKNVNFATPDNDANNASSVYASGLQGKVVFDGCTFTNPQWECIQITPMDGAEVVVTNCTFIVDGNGTYAQAGGTKVERMLHIENTDATGKYTAVITNNRFIGVDLCRNAVIDVDDIEAFANVTCGGNTFADHNGTSVDTMTDGMIYVNIYHRYSPAYVATNTYAQFTQTPAAQLHH